MENMKERLYIYIYSQLQKVNKQFWNLDVRPQEMGLDGCMLPASSGLETPDLNTLILLFDLTTIE